MQQPYSFFDETASLIYKERVPGVLSSVLITFGQQWKYAEKQREGCEKVYNYHGMDLPFLSSFSYYWRKLKRNRESDLQECWTRT